MDHRFEAKSHGFFISPYLQNLMARAGVSEVYTEADELLESLLGIRLSRTQLFRVTAALGAGVEAAEPVLLPAPAVSRGEVVYAIDGWQYAVDRGGLERSQAGPSVPGPRPSGGG